MTSTMTGTLILCGDEPPSILEMMRAIERVNSKVFDAIALPPEIVLRLDDPRRYTADILSERHAQTLPSLFGIQIRFTDLLSHMPVRVHRKRRNQSWPYHNRIQKKWNKRYGVGPVAVLMNTRAAFDTGSPP